jgi:hypothetical protein
MAILNFTSFLIDLGIVTEVIENIAHIMDPANLKHVFSLDDFEE